MKSFIAVEEARSIVLHHVHALPAEDVAITRSVRRTLRQQVRSQDNIPPFTNSAMDGYAVRAGDVQFVPASLEIIEDIPAGAVAKMSIRPGACARIMTGAPVPDGAEAIVPVEWTSEAPQEHVLVNRAPRIGAHIRLEAEDMAAGDLVFEAGQVITPPMVGMMASLGVATVQVSRRPTVAVVTTGDELVPVTEPLAPGKIRDSNGPALAAQAVSAGGHVLGPLHAGDDLESIRAAVRTALAADVVLFSGGVSVGRYDYVRQVLDEMGIDLLFWKVRQRPGKPLAFGQIEGRTVFGLPGNPVSSAICFEQYVRPALAKMLGRTTVMPALVSAVLEEPTPKKAGLHYFSRGIATYDPAGCLQVRDTGPQASNLYSSMVQANCLIHLDEGMEHPAAGTPVMIEWLAWS